MPNSLSNRIEINPEIMLGKPVIKGTCITVEMIIKKLAQDVAIEDILADFPRLTRDDIQAALAYAVTAAAQMK